MMRSGLRYAHEQRIGLRCVRCTFNVEPHPTRPLMVRCINRRCRERGKWREVLTASGERA